jgi:Tfp pilus assembly protein PilP
MMTNLPRLSAVALLALAVSAPAQQNPAPVASATPQAAATGPAGGELIQSILEQELDAPRNGYIYNPAGRRDPFISLARPVASDDQANRPRRPGIEGFLLQETSLKGVVKNNDGWIAVLEGPDKKGYFVRVGQRMHDGVVTGIDNAGLTFRQEITDPLSPAKSRDVRRLLNSAQEESNK